MENKLISMTDFVLEQQKPETNISDSFRKTLSRIYQYANFLKQPLSLSMFFPCDEGGETLEQPCDIMNTDGCRHCACKEYQKAKEKVLFEGCSVEKIDNYYVVYYNSQPIWISWTNRKVEDITIRNLQLTPSALKAIGIKE